MSANRKPSKATADEIREFYKKTKDVISKSGMFYDPITKKYKKALKQDGKSKGSGRPLVADTKYQNFLKRLSDDEKGDLKSLEQRARDKGFSQLQKERKLMMGGLKGVAGASAVVAKQDLELLEKAKKAVGKVPTNVKVKRKEEVEKMKEKLSKRAEIAYQEKKKILGTESDFKGDIDRLKKLKRERDRLKKMKTAGEKVDETKIAQTKLKPKKKKQPKPMHDYYKYEDEKKKGRPKHDVKKGSEEWYNQVTQMVYHKGGGSKGKGEEALKQWRLVQERKYGIEHPAGKGDIMNAVKIQDEMERQDIEQEAQEAHEEAEKAVQKDEEATKRGIESGNLRKKRVEEGAEEQKEQEDKIENVVLDTDKKSNNPLADLADVEQEIDHRQEAGQSTTEDRQEAGQPTEEGYVPPDIAREIPSYFETKEEEEEEEGDGRRRPDREPEMPPPPPPQEQRIQMDITEDEGVELERGYGGQMGQSFISPASERVSMERHRMKYSQRRLYEECRAFVKIYSDDIKTPSWKRLLDRFSKMTEKSLTQELRKIHRELEEEVIEYYQGRKGLRLGVIIDPSVLGIDVGQLQGMMNPQMPMAFGGSVSQVGTQQKRQKVKDIHYHLGGMKSATDEILPEGQNIIQHQIDKRHIKGRVQIPIHPPNRYLLDRSRFRSKKPINLNIKSL